MRVGLNRRVLKIGYVVAEGEITPWGYAPAWFDPWSNGVICFPVVLHLLARWIRTAWHKVRLWGWPEQYSLAQAKRYHHWFTQGYDKGYANGHRDGYRTGEETGIALAHAHQRIKAELGEQLDIGAPPKSLTESGSGAIE